MARNNPTRVRASINRAVATQLICPDCRRRFGTDTALHTHTLAAHGPTARPVQRAS
ncbi:hypothetical protein [Pseudofrankia sp. DC12]|uniref:hypothetical protein n=1 Tax=Pseudofrankia sp. DC12 TaxID=683315 RepID=UPI000B1CCACF|nr:hypothetical protein [Pseudofrankia sp. DC12]